MLLSYLSLATQCPSPPDVQNSASSGMMNRFGNTVNYTCVLGKFNVLLEMSISSLKTDSNYSSNEKSPHTPQ